MPVPAFSTYPAIEPYIKDQVREWFYHGHFLTTLRQGGLTRSQLEYFAVQYGHYSGHFPRILGAAVAAMEPSEDWWGPLADNLWDEAGRGRPGRSHGHLYQTFLHSVHPSLTLTTFACGAAVRTAIDTFLDFFRHASPLEAMAAVGLGSELFASDVMGWILEGLRSPAYQQPFPLNLTFWEVHVFNDEPRHYALCRDVLVRHQGPLPLSRLVEVGLSIAHSESEMYSGILTECMAH